MLSAAVFSAAARRRFRPQRCLSRRVRRHRPEVVRQRHQHPAPRLRERGCATGRLSGRQQARPGAGPDGDGRGSVGLMVCWSDGPVVRWSGGPVVRWSGGPVVRWSGGPVVRWSGGPVVRWSGGPVVRWSDGPTVRRSDGLTV